MRCTLTNIITKQPTKTVWHKFLSTIEGGLDSGLYVLETFLDIEKVFDNAFFKFMFQALEKWNAAHLG